jgi:nucleotide-binding universal stress UspA family protein
MEISDDGDARFHVTIGHHQRLVSTMKSALIATDFSAEASAATQRAASIAAEIGLDGALMHVLPSTLPVDLHLDAATQAQQALAAVAAALRQGGLNVAPRLVSGDVSGELAAAAAQFDLVVAGARGEDVLLDFAMGRTSVRLVRQSRRPTLIVKRPADAPYRRVVAAVDFSEPSRFAAACGVQIAPQAEFVFVHAFEVEFESSMRLGGAHEDKIQGYRSQAREKAMVAMDRFSARLAPPPKRLRHTVSRGYPPRVILDCAKENDAQLIVIGKHCAGIIERSLVGSVALQVLEMAQCDVLIVPEAA